MRKLKIGQRKRPRNGNGSRACARHAGPRSIWLRRSASKRRLDIAISWPRQRPASYPNATKCSPRPARRRLESRPAAGRTSTKPSSSSCRSSELPFAFRPERMARAVIAGPRDKLPSVIETLHEMKLIYIIDHHGEDETFRIGKPLPPAAELAESLVKLRSVGSILAVKVPPGERATVLLDEVREKIQSLELNITEEDAARKKA